ncbi:uncharacterized protein LOC124360326 isoform X2 [Homalodisca vitripennis]|uniref:uncharacterized protein LOC124360326 isoform X2 n=1 Tax=Homalodisca vitripennis TaxID=197043 RepID=UPI001EEB7BCE|nr:uncharacterized protein LOC124360326 isoform X2 [Homalodisca vitripennis]
MIVNILLVAILACASLADSQALNCSELDRVTADVTTRADHAQTRGDKFDEFDWRLSKELNAVEHGHGNIVISPISLKVVLAMLYEGARGTTAQQIGDALDLVNTTVARRRNTRDRFSAILTSLQTSEGEYKIKIGTHVFLDKNAEAKNLYLCKLRRYYNSALEKVDFSDTAAAISAINNWASNVTEGHIQHLVSEAEAHSNTVMLLLNAVYFNGLWEIPFPDNQTATGPFYINDTHTVDVELMNTTDKFKYYDITELDAQLIRLPYLGKKFAMYILLPNNKTGLDALINNLGPERPLTDYISNMTMTSINLIMPKFEFDFTTSLRPILEKIGLVDMFTSAADLSDIAETKSGSLVVSNVLQKAGISVTEIGTEAYAASAVELMDKFGGEEEPIEIRADHPFMFFIEEERIKTTVFVGKVINPEKTKVVDDKLNVPTGDTTPPAECSGASCTALDNRIGDEKEALQTRFNFFDADLLKELSKSNRGNFLVSPASIKTLLALVLEAADGSTFTEIRNLLRLSDNITDARMQLGDLQTALQRSVSSRVIVDCVAQAFVSKALVTNDTYTRIIKDYYDAEVNRQDFNQPQIVTNYINSWINTRTRGLIPTLLDQSFITRETYSILVSAVYFDGKWKKEFQRRNTRSRCFYPEPDVDCQLTPMMTKTEELFYRFDASLDAHVLQIPYQEERFFMVIVLPFKKDGIKQLDLDSSRLVFPALIQKMKLLEVNLTMPRFSIEFETKLSSVLQEMGLNEVFSPKAKLPYIFINKQGKISAMIHKAVMEVTEKGTKAAAGSGASVVPLMHSLDSISLELNQPFYYFVCEVETQAILCSRCFSCSAHAPPRLHQPGVNPFILLLYV